MSMQEALAAFKQETMEKINQVTSLEALNDIRVQALGKKGPLSDILRGMRDLSPEERPVVGKLANEVRDAITAHLEARKELLEAEAMAQKLEEETLDVTLSGMPTRDGGAHVLTAIIDEMIDIFTSMGFQVVDGFEIEEDAYNFERMNLPKDHPARDMQDTFYLEDEYLLRTHTSPVQARTMEKHDFSKGALRMISPGKVYRRDTDDATHSHQFHQLEGLVVGENITMADLRGTLNVLLTQMFGKDREIRLRPSYFPFTEPSVEADISCFKCGGKGCNVCKHTGWIEVLGAGMVHPNVLEMSGIDSTRYSGFAFGVGPDRIAMLRYGINDIRQFYTNDMRFLKQFHGYKED